jgi:PAS domain S-box-containing protein
VSGIELPFLIWSEMKMKFMLIRKMQLAFGAALALILVVGVLSYRNNRNQIETEEWVVHTQEVLATLAGVLSDETEAESARRAYFITGDSVFLRNYETSAAAAYANLARVRQLTVDNAPQQRRLDALDPLITRRLRLLAQLIDSQGHNPSDVAVQVGKTLEGEEIQARVRDLLAEMVAAERILLQSRIAKARASTRTAIFTILLGTGLALGLLGAVLYLLQREITQRTRAEEALREAEESFRTLANNISQLAWMADEKGYIFWYNQRWFDYTGTTLEEMAGWGWQAVHHPDHVQQVVARISKCFQSGEVWEDTFPLRGGDGNYRWFLSRAVPIRDPEGKVLRWFGTNTDITDRKKSEEALRDSEERLRMAVEGAEIGTWFWNIQQDEISWSAKFRTLFGLTSDAKLTYQVALDLIHPDDRQRVDRSVKNTLELGVPYDIEHRVVWPDSSVHWIAAKGRAHRNTEGVAVHMQGIVMDITERNRAEEALQQSEERLSLLIHGLKDYAILMLDPEGRITIWSEGAERMKGYRAEEIIGEHFSKFYMPEDVANDKPSQALKIAAEQGRCEEEGWRVRKDGSLFWASVVITALHDKAGQLRGFGKVTRDITGRKKSEEQLAKTVGELKRSNDELQQFAYVASHDLQEPLRMVASYTQLLAERYKGRLDPDADEFIAYAVDGSNRMQALIQDLLAYSRAGTNGKALREISSENALKEALTNLRGTIEESGAVVTHDALPAITTDDTQLAQIFQNLVGNAIKYRGAEVPHVHVSAEKNGGKEWIFSVRDNGMGIDPQYFERIFILFQRLHGRKEFEGTGMGLAICKKILERLGGRIWVESQPEKGSTFYFALPERDGK